MNDDDNRDLEESEPTGPFQFCPEPKTILLSKRARNKDDPKQ